MLTTGHRKRFLSVAGFHFIGLGLWVPLALLYFHTVKNLSLDSSSGVLTIGGISGLAVGTCINGSLVDRIGAFKSLGISSAVLAVSFTGLMLSEGFWSLVLFQALGVFAGNLLSTGDAEAVRRSSTGETQRTHLFASLAMVRFSVICGGSLLGTIGLKLNPSGTWFWNVLFMVLATSELVAAVKFWRMREIPCDPNAPVLSSSVRYRDVLSNRTFLVFVAGMVALEMAPSSLGTLLALYLRSFGFPDRSATASYMVLCCGVVLGSYLVRILSRHIARFKLLIGATTLSMVGSLMFSGLSVLSRAGVFALIAGLVVAIILFNASEAGGAIVGKGITLSFATSTSSGRYMSVMQSAKGTINAVSPGVFTFLFAVNRSLPFACSAILLAIAVGIFVVVRQLHGDVQRETNAVLVPVE